MVSNETHDPLAVSRRQPLSGIVRPSVSRSIHKRPSGLSMISTMAGSPSQFAIAGPNAVRSMRAPRAVASFLRASAATFAPTPTTRASIFEDD
jgi:hypothetical protein